MSLGPVAHVGLVVHDLKAGMAALAATGVRWSTVTDPVAVLRHPDGTLEETAVRYVTSSGDEPRVKLIQGRAGGYFSPTATLTAVHHLSYWVDELDGPTADLEAVGFRVEVTGLAADRETPAYRYLVAPGLVRVEIGLRADRARFDAWAG